MPILSLLRVPLRAFGLCLALCVAAVLAPAAGAQTPGAADPLEPIRAAFEAGRSGDVLAHAGARVEMAVLGASRLYSRAQAHYVLDHFFDDYPPRSFELRDRAQAGTGMFVEGDYWCPRLEAPLRIYLRLHRSGEAWQLREILVERPSF